MKMRNLMALAGGSLLVACSASGPEAKTTDDSALESSSWQRAEHVLLLSLDGFHPFDMENYIAAHPTSALADVKSRGVNYTNATSSRPSDSFPGTLAMVTGGSPRSTGVFYDISWDDNLSPPGSDCSTRGTVVTYNQAASFDPNDLNTTINPAKLPRDPDNGCAPVYPHSYLQVNTVYEVIKAAGGRTAAIDKHATYELLQGPSGAGVDDLYTPEAEANGAKKSIVLTQQNDEFKVQALLNELRGFDHTGTTQVGVPAILGMNFQAPNIGQKIGGYTNASGDLSPGLSGAFDYVDGAIGRIVGELRAQGLLDSTRIILTAKHANAPVDPAARRAIDPLNYTTIINGVQAGLVGQVTADTVALVWLKDHSKTPDVLAALQANQALLGAETFYSGDELATAFGGAFASSANRRPDIIVQPAHGVVYTTATKLADHGGFTEEDLHVPLIVSQPGLQVRDVDYPVNLRQVAPTILMSLGLRWWELQAVQREYTFWLPGLSQQ